MPMEADRQHSGLYPVANHRSCGRGRGRAGAYDLLVSQIIGLFDADGRGSHPIPEQGPDFGWPPKGLELEARAAASDGKRRKEKFKIALVSAIGWVLFKTGWKTKNFDPAHYRRMTGLNTDFRKFNDVLRITVDCTPQSLARAKTMLEAAKADGTIRYGIYEQDVAIMTCIVPSIETDYHLHFLDGASGCCALAAKMMKAG